MRLPQHRGGVRSHPWWQRPGTRRWPGGAANAAALGGPFCGSFQRAIRHPLQAAESKGASARRGSAKAGWRPSQRRSGGRRGRR
eukprot:8336034-Lingulodinium_polyedra.AAC.1